VARGFFRAHEVRRLIDDHVAGTRNNADKIWALIQLELWLRTYVDAKPTGPLALDLAAA
jgi:asparagine synthase (glutamine-hydrolysing)